MLRHRTPAALPIRCRDARDPRARKRPLATPAVGGGWHAGVVHRRRRHLRTAAADHAVRAAGGAVLFARQRTLGTLAAGAPALRADRARLARSPCGAAARQAAGLDDDGPRLGVGA